MYLLYNVLLLIVSTVEQSELAIVVQLLNHVQLFATPWIVAHQASLSFTISWNFLKLMSIELVMLSNHLILCCPLLLLPSVFPSIRVFSNELALRVRWPKCWSFSFSIILPMNIHGWNGNPLQYSCLENPMDRGAWWATIYGFAKSQTRLSDFCVYLISLYALNFAKYHEIVS